MTRIIALSLPLVPKSLEIIFNKQSIYNKPLNNLPKGLELLAQEAMDDVSFMLRTAHLQKLNNILNDPEATDNDRFVAYNLLQNAAVAIEGQLPSCQDTGTAIVMAKKGENVYTGVDDAEWLSKGIFNTYQKKNLRY